MLPSNSVETAYIALGANIPSHIGAPEVTLSAAAERIATLGRIVSHSSLYSTAPVGFADQPRFVNAVLALETSLPAEELLRSLLEIEQIFGRDRINAIHNGPRPLDLDILLYGQQVFREPHLEVPHPRLAERAFVLVPLSEIASALQVPTLGRTVKELLESLRAHAAYETEAVIPLPLAPWRAGTSSANGPVHPHS